MVSFFDLYWIHLLYGIPACVAIWITAITVYRIRYRPWVRPLLPAAAAALLKPHQPMIDDR
jgi:hypothetical protein